MVERLQKVRSHSSELTIDMRTQLDPVRTFISYATLYFSVLVPDFIILASVGSWDRTQRYPSLLELLLNFVKCKNMMAGVGTRCLRQGIA